MGPIPANSVLGESFVPPSFFLVVVLRVVGVGGGLVSDMGWHERGNEGCERELLLTYSIVVFETELVDIVSASKDPKRQEL